MIQYYYDLESTSVAPQPANKRNERKDLESNLQIHQLESEEKVYLPPLLVRLNCIQAPINLTRHITKD